MASIELDSEDVPSVIQIDEDEDEDMANLFSFGSSDTNAKSTENTEHEKIVGVDAGFLNDLGIGADPSLSAALGAFGKPNRSDAGGTKSPDSFLELLAAETSNVVFMEGSDSMGMSAINSSSVRKHDAATQEMLDWLDSDDAASSTIPPFTSKLTPPIPPKPIEATVVELPPVFASFAEAMASKEATVEQIRSLFVKEQSRSDDRIVTGTQRVELYCRMICHKSLDAIVGGSLADSFDQWRASRPEVQFDSDPRETNCTTWIQQQKLALSIAQLTSRTAAECEKDLIDLVLYHQHSSQQKHTVASSETGDTQHSAVRKDHLLPMVAATLLASGIPTSAAAVVLSQIIPSYMPLLALPPETERWEAALFLHSEFYLLACYHVPLLVFHLDRYFPGWYWPKLPIDDPSDSGNGTPEETSAVAVGRNLTKQGQIPPSWLLSHLSGECDGTALPMDMVLMLWDGIFTEPNNATRFFLALAVLERFAPSLLLLTGDKLGDALRDVWSLKGIDEDKEASDKEWRYEWWSEALCLQSSTPVSVLERLQNVEDQAVQHALQRRQERAETALRERLEAEATAYKETQELKAEEARQRLSRARLVAFYRKHAPDKESNIEKIMETYAGRLDVLDAKLKEKYGEGFNPAIKAKPPPPPKTPSSILAKMNRGLKSKKSGIDDEVLENAFEERKPDQVSVFVSAEEVLPIVCWSKEAAAARGVDHRRRNVKSRKQRALKFYLIDCRSDEAAQEQGKFPTAFRLSPETLQDPEKLQEHEDTFESFRGAVHLAIMGEGFNAIPGLYSQKLSPKLQELMEQDESRTNLCALFFQKRGFCFVSLLSGGFCAAHSWLVREGPKHHLNATAVLVDYNPETAIFGQLEKLHNASVTEKAQRKMASLLEASMVSVTKRAYQLERLTSELNESKDGQRQGFRKLFGRSDATPTAIDDSEDKVAPLTTLPKGDDSSINEKASVSSFQNPFATIAKRDENVTEPSTTPINIAEGTSSEPSISPPIATATNSATPSDKLEESRTVAPPLRTSSAPSPSTTTTGNTPSVAASIANPLGKFFQQPTSAVEGTNTKSVQHTRTKSNDGTSNETGAIPSNSNPFKGLGAAFNQTRARFGAMPPAVNSTSTASNESSTPTAVASGGFGFNQLRKSAMSRVLQATNTTNPVGKGNDREPSSATTAATGAPAEESISFT
jgi:hypothetical protein